MLRVGIGMIGAALMLSGCFASKQPLITVATADRPFADGATFTEFSNCTGEASAMLGCSGYTAGGLGSLSLKEGTYILKPDPGDEASAVMAAQSKAGDPAFLLKRIGDDLFLVQLAMGPASSGADDPYIYELMQIKGDTAYLYLLTCEENGDRRYVRSGQLTGITNALMTPTCEATDPRKLGKVFRDRLAIGAVPDKKFQFKS